MTKSNDAQADGQSRVYQASGDQHISEHHHYSPDWSGPDSVRRPAVGRPPLVLRDRSAEMDRLRAAIQPGIGNRVYVLHGLGGCGKTAVAYALFDHATNEAGRVGLWVNASDQASLRAGMLAVAADRGATDAELVAARSGLRPAADLVWHYLDRSVQPWFLVLDNADTPAILRDGSWLRTSPAGTVVVTSRQAAGHWWPGAELLRFGVLPRDAAALVLQDFVPEAGSVEDAAAVADRLGRLPLALVLAGGFLAGQVIDPWTLADYCQRLDSDPELDSIELIDQGSAAIAADSRHLVSRTWQLSLDALNFQGLPEATHLLRLLACWASDPLPVSLLSGAELGSDLPGFRVEPALRGLLDQSLTELMPGSVRCLRTHGVLLDSVARAIGPEQREQIAITAARLLLAELPPQPERGAQEPRLALLAPHALALLHRVVNWRLENFPAEVAAQCALQLAIGIHRSGDYASALTFTVEAAELASRHLGTDHVLALRLRQRIGQSLHRLGRFEESEKAQRKTLEHCERIFGLNSLDTLVSCIGLGKALSALGNTRDAISLQQRAIAGLQNSLGSLHPYTLWARAALLEYSATSDADNIITNGLTVITECSQALGESHQITLGAELNYAYALSRKGQPQQALAHVRRAFTGFRQYYDPNYPIMLSAQQTLSAVLAALGHKSEAIRHAEDLVARRTAVLGPNHPWTIHAQKLLKNYKALRSKV